MTFRFAGAISLALTVSGPPVSAAPASVTGELVDVQCQSKDAKNVGVDHADCALSCARRGATLGILAPDGLYVVTGDFTRESNRRLVEWVAKTVEATGTVSEKDGKKLIAVTDIKRVGR